MGEHKLFPGKSVIIIAQDFPEIVQMKALNIIAFMGAMVFLNMLRMSERQ